MVSAWKVFLFFVASVIILHVVNTRAMSVNSFSSVRAGLVLLFVFLSGCGTTKQVSDLPFHASGMTQKGQHTRIGEKNLYSGYEPVNENGDVQVVVEIPAGTNDKWEVKKSSGNLERDFKKGKPRVVHYLAYPGNYGMIPRTLLPEELGGDGDPLDVIVLGPSVPRGTILSARVIGMIRMLDGGEQDDKLIAVMLNSHFGDINSLEALENRYKGATAILDLWFSNYKGPGIMQSGGIVAAEEAKKVLTTAIDAYDEKERSADK